MDTARIKAARAWIPEIVSDTRSTEKNAPKNGALAKSTWLRVAPNP